MGPGRRAGAGRGLAPNLQEEASVPDSAVHVPPSSQHTSHCVFLSLMALRGHAKGPSIAEGPRHGSPMLTFMFALPHTTPPWDLPALR